MSVVADVADVVVAVTVQDLALAGVGVGVGKLAVD
jgi:hypothetical protein